MENKEPTPEELRAAIELWNAARKLVTALHDMAQKRPELLRPIARQIILWPGFISRKRAFDTENAKLMDKIELGVGGPYSTKQWRISATSTQFAIRLHLEGQKHAKQLGLPPLTKKNKKTWFERIWKYAVDDLNIEPEKNPVLAKLGKSATRKRSGWDAKYRGHACDVRAEIKRQVFRLSDDQAAISAE